MNLGDIDKRRNYAKKVYASDPKASKTIDQMFGLVSDIIFKHEENLMAFLDPAQRDILQTLCAGDILIQEFGGYEDAEKQRVYLAQEWLNLQPSNFQVSLFEIIYPVKFAHLTHSAILGKLANAGVETATFGDIITDGQGRWQFFGETELQTFFTQEITRIGRIKVKVNKVRLKDILTPEDDSQEKVIVAPSLRLDAVLAKASNQSRSQIKPALESGLVKLNWHEVKDSNIMVKVDDIISLRHFGRIKVMSITTTRKSKYKVVLKLWQTHAKN